VGSNATFCPLVTNEWLRALSLPHTQPVPNPPSSINLPPPHCSPPQNCPPRNWTPASSSAGPNRQTSAVREVPLCSPCMRGHASHTQECCIASASRIRRGPPSTADREESKCWLQDRALAAWVPALRHLHEACKRPTFRTSTQERHMYHQGGQDPKKGAPKKGGLELGRASSAGLRRLRQVSLLMRYNVHQQHLRLYEGQHTQAAIRPWPAAQLREAARQHTEPVRCRHCPASSWLRSPWSPLSQPAASASAPAWRQPAWAWPCLLGVSERREMGWWLQTKLNRGGLNLLKERYYARRRSMCFSSRRVAVLSTTDNIWR